MKSHHRFVIRAVVLAVLALLPLGCEDEAEPDFKRCEELESKGEYEQAIEACELAHSKAPESDYGKKAEAKIPVLERGKKKKAKMAVAIKRMKANMQYLLLRGVTNRPSDFGCHTVEELVSMGKIDKGSRDDPWGTAYTFTCNAKGDMTVVSAGPDRKAGTKDDIIYDPTTS